MFNHLEPCNREFGLVLTILFKYNALASVAGYGRRLKNRFTIELPNTGPLAMNKPRHSHTTLPNALGELELCVMEHVWSSPGLDAKQIVGRIAEQRPSKLSTVQSTLERLVRKRILSRKKRGHAFMYFPQKTRGELLGRLMRDVIGLLHDGSTDTILSSFVNVADTIDDKALDELEALIVKKRRQREN